MPYPRLDKYDKYGMNLYVHLHDWTTLLSGVFVKRHKEIARNITSNNLFFKLLKRKKPR